MNSVQTHPSPRPALYLIPAPARQGTPAPSHPSEDWTNSLITAKPGQRTQSAFAAWAQSALPNRNLGPQSAPANGLAERIFAVLLLTSVAALWFSQT